MVEQLLKKSGNTNIAWEGKFYVRVDGSMGVHG